LAGVQAFGTFSGSPGIDRRTLLLGGLAARWGTRSGGLRETAA